MATIDPFLERDALVFAHHFNEDDPDPESLEVLLKHERGLDDARARLLVLVAGQRALESMNPQPDYDDLKRKIKQQIGRLEKARIEAPGTGDSVLFQLQVRKEQQRLREHLVELEGQKVRAEEDRYWHFFILRVAAIYEDDNHVASWKQLRDESKGTDPGKRRMEEVSPFIRFLEYLLNIDGENNDESRYVLALQVRSALREPDRLGHDPILDFIRETIAENQKSAENI